MKTLLRIGQWVGHALSYARGSAGQAPMSKSMHDSLQYMLEQVWGMVVAHERRQHRGWGVGNERGRIETKHASAFVIAGTTFFQHRMYQTIELCHIVVSDEYQGRGFATEFINKLEKMSQSSHRMLVISNVMNDGFDRSLTRRSDEGTLAYLRLVGYKGYPTYYLKPPVY